MAVATKRMTIDDFLALPEEKPYREFVRGEVYEKVMGDPAQSAIIVETIGQVGGWLKLNPIARPGTQLTHAERGDEDRVYLPDVSVTQNSRYPAGQRRGVVEVHPDIAIEVLSPDDRAGLVNDKVQFNLRAGVAVTWVIDPEAETLTEYRPDRAPQQFRSPQAVSAEPVLPGFELDLEELFAVLHQED